MTDRATFGELAAAVDAHLSRAVSLASSAATGHLGQPGGMHAADARRRLSTLVAVMDRCLDDISGARFSAPPDWKHLPRSWARAGAEAQGQLRTAAALLAPDRDSAYRIGRRDPASPVGHSLEAAATALAAGRDLLGTHLSTGPDRSKISRSEWAPVISSVPVSGALLLELGRYARQAAACGRQVADLATVPEPYDQDAAEAEARQRLRAACEALRNVSSAIAQAQRTQPVSAADIQLLRAIPVNLRPERQAPGARASCAELRLGATGSAERLRHLALTTDPGALWVPDLTGRALRETAACATAISHHCAVVLRTLGTSPRASQVSDALFESAAAAEKARDAWLGAAKSWRQIAADGPADGSPLLAEARNLALWTGRLAYADPAWTLADGPRRPVKTPASLVEQPGDLSQVIAAAHQSCDALVQLAASNRQHIRAQAEAGRFYVPTRSLPVTWDIARPFTAAPMIRLNPVLDAYDQASQASQRATATVAQCAEAVRAPSMILTAARQAVTARRTGLVTPTTSRAGGSAGNPVPARHLDRPGHYERLVTELGQTDPELLRRAAAADLAGEELIIETARAVEARDLARDVETSAKELNLSWRTRSRANERAARLEREAEF